MKNKYFFYGVCNVIVGFLLCLFLLKGNPHNISRWIHYAVWGNVADWCMTVITGFTAFYLVKTFREQRKTTEIEQSRFLQEIKPSLKVAFKNKELVLLVEKNGAYNVVIINKSDKDVEIKDLSNEAHFENIQTGVPLFLDRNFQFPANTESALGIEIYYSDRLGNNYKQTFIALHNKHVISMELVHVKESPFDPRKI
ncbi:hypothetical protein E2P86_08695 [Sphingobacterium psychroaquaticum]|uniref:hypothetical protein n=1 Tax=Sphingobacterium psychroaquaticum TaxID=561061 RepID=UPI00106CC0E5|nr:hypothetical protein [Sphingobacterium psychroaquaticum]QBQ41231.1 hypothetical protein E2P86_08695 [Sphingobacterium psychroaquaticum]